MLWAQSGCAPRLEDVSSWPSLTICSVQKACTTGEGGGGGSWPTRYSPEERRGRGKDKEGMEGGALRLVEEQKELGMFKGPGSGVEGAAGGTRGRPGAGQVGRGRAQVS